MENKKLVNILLKDMAELDELISEVKAKGSFDSLEIDFIHTRSKGILQLLKMLNYNEPSSSVTKVEEAPIVREVTEIIELKTESPVHETYDKTIEEEISNVSAENVKASMLKPEKVAYVEDDSKAIGPSLKEGVNNDPDGEFSSVHEKEDMAQRKDEVELEDEVVSEANYRLGDSFLKEKSVNDMITDQNKLEFMLSNRPVESIQSAIGINDRFQYIRELFEGNGEKFTETVQKLDSMNNIREAVEFLRYNFKWKKNETSLKFVNLVKRRFPND